MFLKTKSCENIGKPLPDGRGSVRRTRGCSHLQSRDRQGAVAVLGGIVAIALAAAGCSKSSKVEAKPTPPAATASAAETVSLSAEQLRQFKTEAPVERNMTVVREATGKVAYNEDNATPVFSPYAGRVVRLLAKPGEAAEKGAPLAEIDTPDILSAESDLLTGRSALAKAQTVLRQAQRNRDRLQRLVAGEAAPAKDLEQATTDAQNAENDLRAAESSCEALRQRVAAFGKSPDEIDRIVATRQLDRIARVFAPIGGTVVARKVGPGQYVRPDAPDPMFAIADLSSMWLLADVYESDVAGVRLNEAVQVRVIAFPQQVFKARITYIAPSVDPVTRRIAVRCAIPNPGRRLKPEMFASFRIPDGSSTALTVSQRAVIREGDQRVVWVVKGNELVRHVVTTGVEQEGWVEIRSGLAASDRVVADGALFVSNMRNS